MIRRFQIEDLISQDESGVIFRALDTQTGQGVAVRRFFPFGANGGGLLAEEQDAYNTAIERLAGLRHPSLRAILCGGCDPVDGMPFIASEWIDGDPLSTFLQQGPLAAEIATELITSALEVSELFSHVLGEDAIWVETGPHSIIVGSEASGRGFTFWISPHKWLGGQNKSNGLEAVANLTEKVMGWQGRKINDQAGHGLGGWLKWLRHAGDRINLHEARETLAASVGVNPPAPSHKLVTQATLPPATAVKLPSNKKTWVIKLGLALVALGLGGWVVERQGGLQSRQPPTFARKEALPSKPPAAVHRETELAEPATAPNGSEPGGSNAIAMPRSASDLTGLVIPWNSRGLLGKSAGKKVVVEGVLEKIDLSGTKKTLYLLFSKQPGISDTRGAVLLGKAPADLSVTTFTPLLGKKIRLHGTVSVQHQRPEILIKDRASVVLVK